LAVIIQFVKVNCGGNVLNSLKAISLGVITIFILGLVNQLVLILSTVGYHSLIEYSSIFAPWSQLFTYILAGIGVFIVMATGGLVTARAALEHAYSKAIIASVLGSSISLYLSLKDEIFTPIALFFMTYGIISSVIGCWIWKKYQQKQNNKGTVAH
jgi:hypothetical protein